VHCDSYRVIFVSCLVGKIPLRQYNKTLFIDTGRPSFVEVPLFFLIKSARNEQMKHLIRIANINPFSKNHIAGTLQVRGRKRDGTKSILFSMFTIMLSCTRFTISIYQTFLVRTQILRSIWSSYCTGTHLQFSACIFHCNYLLAPKEVISRNAPF